MIICICGFMRFLKKSKKQIYLGYFKYQNLKKFKLFLKKNNFL